MKNSYTTKIALALVIGASCAHSMHAANAATTVLAAKNSSLLQKTCALVKRNPKLTATGLLLIAAGVWAYRTLTASPFEGMDTGHHDTVQRLGQYLRGQQLAQDQRDAAHNAPNRS